MQQAYARSTQRDADDRCQHAAHQAPVQHAHTQVSSGGNAGGHGTSSSSSSDASSSDTEHEDTSPMNASSVEAVDHHAIVNKAVESLLDQNSPCGFFQLPNKDFVVQKFDLKACCDEFGGEKRFSVACIHPITCTYAPSHMDIYFLAATPLFAHARTRTCAYIRAYIPTYIHACTQTHTHIHTYTHTQIHT